MPDFLIVPTGGRMRGVETRAKKCSRRGGHARLDFFRHSLPYLLAEMRTVQAASFTVERAVPVTDKCMHVPLFATYRTRTMIPFVEYHAAFFTGAPVHFMTGGGARIHCAALRASAPVPFMDLFAATVADAIRQIVVLVANQTTFGAGTAFPTVILIAFLAADTAHTSLPDMSFGTFFIAVPTYTSLPRMYPKKASQRTHGATFND